MARRRKQGGSIYLSTNPENNVPIGAAGTGTSIGRMGTWIFKDTGGATQAPSLAIEGGSIAFTPATVPVALEFA